MHIFFRSLLTSFFVFSLLSIVNAQSITEYPPLVEISKQYRNQLEGVSNYTLLSMDDNVRKSLKKAKANNLKISIPLNDEKTFILDLDKFQVASQDFVLTTSAGDTIKDYEVGTYYKGTIKGENGFATLGISGDHIVGMISTERDGNFTFAKMKNDADYVIFNSKNFLRNNSFQCHTPDDPIELELDIEMMNDLSTRSLSDCVKVYIEGDDELRQNKGGVSEASDYIMDVFSVVAVLYDNESINTEISEIMIWTSNDGYDNNDAGNALDQFEDNNPNPNGDLAHLFSLGGNGTGGLAWVDVLCGGPEYAYSNISSWYQDFPTYSWTIEVVTHEMGHNLGSPHTHNCSWPGGAIDDCYDTEGSCAPGATPTNGGTIMSYCHLSSTGINFNNGFGNLPGNLIRDEVSTANCISACVGGVLAPEADFTFVEGDGCAPSVVQFFDNSTNGPTSWLWTFDGGTPSTSTDQNPIVTYIDPGVYDVLLSVTNGGGADDVAQYQIVEVITDPIVDFTYIVDVNEVAFENITTGATSYFWNFGDGEDSNAENPTHTYTDDSVYVVTLLGSNACGAPLVTHNVTIATQPVGAFSVVDTAGCADFVVTFDNNSSSNVDSYEWFFTGGTPATSTDETPTVTYSTAGDFDVELIVTNAQGTNSVILEDYISAYDFPTAAITPTINGQIVNFSAPNYSGASYAWDFGDGMTGSTNSSTHTYAAEGNYNVVLITDNGICSDTSSVEIDILLTPNVVFSGDMTEDCETLTVNFTNGTAGTNTYLWSFPGGAPATSTEENPTVTYNDPGDYSVTLAATNSAGTTTLEETDYLTVHAEPTINFSYTNAGLAVDFSNLSTDATSFSWDFGDGNSSNEMSPANTYAEEGIYTVVLIGTYPCGTVEQSLEVNLFTQPTAAFSASETEGCEPFTVDFINESSVNADTYSWSFEGGTPSTSTDENPTVVYASAGTYDVALTATNMGGDNAVTQTSYITVLSATASNFGYTVSNNSVSFANSSTNATTFGWTFGDGNASDEENPTHTYENIGVYTVTLKVSGPCGDDEITFDVSIQPDASRDEELNDIDIFPNPVEDRLIVRWNKSVKDLKVDIYNIYGVRVNSLTGMDYASDNELMINMNQVISGSYILKLSSNNEQKIEKIVVY